MPVLDGHTDTVFVSFETKPSKEEILKAWKEFKGLPQELDLPSAPKQFIGYQEEEKRPQVSMDVDYENVRGVTIGRLREDSLFDSKVVGLSQIKVL